MAGENKIKATTMPSERALTAELAEEHE